MFWNNTGKGGPGRRIRQLVAEWRTGAVPAGLNALTISFPGLTSGAFL